MGKKIGRPVGSETNIVNTLTRLRTRLLMKRADLGAEAVDTAIAHLDALVLSLLSLPGRVNGAQRLEEDA